MCHTRSRNHPKFSPKWCTHQSQCKVLFTAAAFERLTTPRVPLGHRWPCSVHWLDPMIGNPVIIIPVLLALTASTLHSYGAWAKIHCYMGKCITKHRFHFISSSPRLLSSIHHCPLKHKTKTFWTAVCFQLCGNSLGKALFCSRTTVPQSTKLRP